MFKEVLFYILAGAALLSAGCVITAKNPVRAVLHLIVTFLITAGIWLLLEAEFLAATLILVYVGAVMVLLLFVVMMLNIDHETRKQSFVVYFPIAICLAAFLFILLANQFAPSNFGFEIFPASMAKTRDYSNINQLAVELFSNYLLQFELAGIILLVAIIAAITLTFRSKQCRKSQHPSEQVLASKTERITIIDLPTDDQYGE